MPSGCNLKESSLMATEATAQEIARKAFEDRARFMRVEWSLEWDPAGFYSDRHADAAFIWFELGFKAQTQPNG
jgi:hypothetical protein